MPKFGENINVQLLIDLRGYVRNVCSMRQLIHVVGSLAEQKKDLLPESAFAWFGGYRGSVRQDGFAHELTLGKSGFRNLVLESIKIWLRQTQLNVFGQSIVGTGVLFRHDGNRW